MVEWPGIHARMCGASDAKHDKGVDGLPSTGVRRVCSGHHPRGTTHHEALRGKLAFQRTLLWSLGGAQRGSAGVPWGLNH